MQKKLHTLLFDSSNNDDRLLINDKNTTRYGCHTQPYSHLSYSSCTASTIGLEAYMFVKDYLENNIQTLTNSNLIDEFQSIRDNLRSILGLNDNNDICLALSGTDLEMLPYLFVKKGSTVTNIIVAPDEVGSGITLAAEGRWFSHTGIDKYHISYGDTLEGFENYNINIVHVPIRDNDGNVLSDDEVFENIKTIVKDAKDKSDYIFVHSVFHSKTGLIKPLPTKLFKLSKEISNMIILIDACQFRISSKSINKFLNEKCIVFITGSKFYGGPTFSAAALVSRQLRDFAANNSYVPSGINHLYGRELFPKRWHSVNKLNYNNNLGLLLRWKAALFEIQLFNAINNEKVLNTITIFNECISSVQKNFPNISIIFSDETKDIERYDRKMSETIITIGFSDPKIDFEMSQKVYQELVSMDLLDSKEFPLSIHLGQPVKIKKHKDKWLGTLRIALSSNFFVKHSGKIKSIQKDIITKEIEYIFRAIQKILLS